MVGLVTTHGAGVVVAAFASADAPAPSSALFIALVFCQTSLIGMWGGFGRSQFMFSLGLLRADGYRLAAR